MLLGADQTLRDAIIKVLLEDGARSYAQLRHALVSAGLDYTKQAIYTELNQLIRQLVVIKRGRSFDLRLCWLSELSKMVETRLASHQAQLASSLAARVEEIKCRSLYEAQSVWSALVHELMFSGVRGCYYEWVEHCWFQLSSSRTEEQILSQHSHFGVEYRLVLGQDTPLSRDSLVCMSKVAGGFSIASTVIPALSEVCLSVLGDTSITVKLPAALARSIDSFFGAHRPLSKKVKSDFAEIASHRHDITIILRRDAAKAQSLRSILENECKTQGVHAFGAANSLQKQSIQARGRKQFES